ncbi:hypothetical protein [Pyrobaculum aerophilum]|uniref:Uncharacterized protein n=1 Tax=Pyrobaculum aerophilum TaxID=13773 RepID=A0A371R5X8_9CREN|nr:hypothetical protein [Pyrobaculum aerophilum]RFA92814.1 hypothetical protein CGL51_13975 [Pyrobaculum aerophilum]RFA99482.1 hypothetical protein CGL52_02765 [Pyrobaculum aerophilum]
MSRAVLYKRSEELKQRFSLYGLLTSVFHLVTMLVGGVAYASSNLPVYLSLNAAAASGYGTAVFAQSLLVLLSLIILAVSALLVFLSRATTARGEFSSSNKLLFSAVITSGLAFVFALFALIPPASQIINAVYYIFVAMQVACIALISFAFVLLKSVMAYYTPRRK